MGNVGQWVMGFVGGGLGWMEVGDGEREGFGDGEGVREKERVAGNEAGKK